MSYNDINKHSRDWEIHFEAESHTYSFRGETFTSVTNIVEKCFEAFDTEYWASHIAAKTHQCVEDVKKQWAEKGLMARTLGTQMHEKIERFYLGLPNEDDETYALFRQFTQVYHLVPFRSEWAIYDEESKVAGTLDFLHYADGKFILFDWKRSNKLVSDGKPITHNRYGKTALEPIKNIADTTYWHYALQVSIYRYILEKNYGIPTSGGKLGVFHPDNRRFHVFDVPYLRNEAISVLKHHKMKQFEVQH